MARICKACGKTTTDRHDECLACGEDLTETPDED